jgi:ligand-binding SRPBCC domain-containing protein
MRHHLETELDVPVPTDRVFEFFGAAENLQRITPPELGFQILTPLPIEIQTGSLIDYRIRLFGIPMRWRTEITVWEPPRRFVDVQVKGPYKEWIHTHTFESSPTGTLIRDHVQYKLPLTPLGDVVLPAVRLQLRRIFAYREEATRRLLIEGTG